MTVNLERFHALVPQIIRFRHTVAPVSATQLGVHDQDHRLGDFDTASLAQNVAQAHRFLDQLLVLDPAGWPVDDQIDYRLLAAALHSDLRTIEAQDELHRNPVNYLNVALLGPYQLLTREYAPLEIRLRDTRGRLRDVPLVLDAARNNLENPARVWTEAAIDRAGEGLGLLSQFIPAVAGQTAVKSLMADVLVASRNATFALGSFRDWLRKDLLPRSDGSFATGVSLYERMLREDLHLDWSAEQVLGAAQRVYIDARQAIENLAAAVAPGEPAGAVLAAASTQGPTSITLIEAYRQAVSQARTWVLAGALLSLPSTERLTVAETPPLQRGNVPPGSALYDEVSDHLFVTPGPPSHSYGSITLAAAREAYPGRYIQAAWAKANPSLVRAAIRSPLAVEGWAGYAEELAERQGFVQDPGARLLRLAAQLRRAAYAVADAGLHTRDFTLSEAANILRGGGLSELEAQAEARRLTYSPTIGLAGLLGHIEYVRLLRDRAASSGTLGQFHTRLLQAGFIPPTLAELKVKN